MTAEMCKPMIFRYRYAQQLFWGSGNDPERLALLGRTRAVLCALGSAWQCAQRFARNLDPAAVMWRGDLLGGGVRSALFARHMGPERNAELIAVPPDRQPWDCVVLDAAALPAGLLLPYDEGIHLLQGAL